MFRTKIICPACGNEVEFDNSSIGHCIFCEATLMIVDSIKSGKVEVLRRRITG